MALEVDLAQRGAQTTFLDYLGAIDALVIRRETLEATIAELVPTSPWARDIAKLRCLRGIDTLTAVGLCAETQDFARFEHPKQLMSYVGLVTLRAQLRPVPPPRRDHQVRLRSRGPERGGATITAVLHKPRALVLLIRVVRRHRTPIVGFVSLGTYPAGPTRIHWNLRVDGHTLPTASTRSACTRSPVTCSRRPPLPETGG
ncbi:MAG TPA: transposase [Solirubrobacteraceae bacterium]|jgi:hypothetical protein